jgi:cation:H+ antiporter
MTGGSAVLLVILSTSVLVAASRFSLGRAVALARLLNVPPFVLGFVLLAVGTDLPEIVSCIAAASMEQGDFVVGDAVGSVFTQGTFVLGLFPLVASAAFPVARRDVVLLPALSVAALLLGAGLMRDGEVSRVDALMLISVWLAGTVTVWRFRRAADPPERDDRRLKPAMQQALWVLAGLAAVGVAAHSFVYSVTVISKIFSAPVYLLSFFGASLGTSLPELAVEITALRRGQRAMALGDVLGSCFVDASLSLGIGPLLFPVAVSAAYALKGSAVAAAAMLLIAGLLGLRRRHDLGSGLVLMAAYLLAYRLL